MTLTHTYTKTYEIPLLPGETCYAVTNLERLPNGHEPWVCWRHVRPDEGPIKASKKA